MKYGIAVCHTCGEGFERPLKHITHSRKNGRKSYCSRSCATSDRNSKYEQGSANARFVQVLGDARKRAARCGYDFDICESFLSSLLDKQRGQCAMSGVKMDAARENGNPLFFPSIDRINNDLGYTRGNIQLTCRGVNYMKNRWTDEQAMELLLAIACPHN